MITNDPVLAAMHGARGAVYAAGILSLMSNMLTLIGPLFMLQIYDRVLPSRSVPTLVVLFVMVVVLYGFYALVEWLRSRISTRLGNLFEARIGRVALNAMLRQTPAGNASRLELIRNSDTIRNFLSGPGPIAMLDIPWLPFYLVLVFVLHPALGWLSIAGALTMAVLLVLNDRLSLRPARKAAAAASQRQRQLNEAIGNVDSIWAMGMTDAVVERLTQVSSTIGDANRQAFDTMAIFGALTKGMRYLLQSAMLAMGAYLVIEGQLSAGLIIATSILTSRALVPIEQLVSQGKNWAVTVQAWKDLRHALLTSEPIGTLLPVPTRDLVVRQLAAGHGTGGDPIVTGAAFRLVAGDCLAILGRSGSGKSTLGRALVGINAPMQGDIRLDGSELSHYDRDMIGQVIGYLPQQVDLFAGTVMENIARLDPDMAFPEVLRAAQLAGTHDLIAALPDGYQTLVGSQQHDLSAGQRQRIGLARALYKDPFLLVLDEPNANLDAEGDAALAEAIIAAKARGAIVVIIAHRPSAVETANKVLYLQNGRQAAFGNRDEILARITHPRPAIEARMAAGGMRSV